MRQGSSLWSGSRQSNQRAVVVVVVVVVGVVVGVVVAAVFLARHRTNCVQTYTV